MRQLWLIIGHVLWVVAWLPIRLITSKTRRTRVLIISGSHVLLTKDWLGSSKWKLPGGGIKKGEAVKNAAIREVIEETGLRLESHQLEEMDVGHPNTNRLFFSAILDRRPPLTKRPFFDEISEVRWIKISDLNQAKADKSVRLALSVYTRADQ